jgi:hypothetical protein
MQSWSNCGEETVQYKAPLSPGQARIRVINRSFGIRSYHSLELSFPSVHTETRVLKAVLMDLVHRVMRS